MKQTVAPSIVLLVFFSYFGRAETCVRPRLHWTVAAVEKCLQSNGLKVRRDVAIRQPFLHAKGVVLVVNDGEAEIQTYVYRSSKARAIDTDQLDPTNVSPPTMRPHWLMRPSLKVDHNLASIILTNDEGLRKRMTEALSCSIP